jgi:CDGSH-type Zn-finger protein
VPGPRTTRTTEQKLAVFRACFSGLTHVYGTYDPASGHAWQVKRRVTDAVIVAHLQGRRPYGVYLLVNDLTRAVAVDFDVDDLDPPIRFREGALGYGLVTYIERSKSKGHHVWMFFDEAGVPAAKARLVVRRILDEIGQPNTEVFPKHDRLDTGATYGNYIYAPLFGALVPHGRTVFLDPGNGFKPHAEQWHVLETVKRITQPQLDEVIEVNDLTPSRPSGRDRDSTHRPTDVQAAYGLPPCAQRMLAEGVNAYQRVACFRLAVQLKKAGLPEDITAAALIAWAAKNRPLGEKRVIAGDEIITQVNGAFSRDYRSCGCGDPAVQPFCDAHCSVRGLATTVASPETEAAISSKRSNTMSDPSVTRPVKELRVRNIRLSIWEHEGTRDGQAVRLHSITLNKRYRDSATGKWTDSGSFFPDDLPRLRLLLDKAYEHILLRDSSAESEADEANGSDGAVA